MPTYDYKCQTCGAVASIVCKPSQAAPPVCKHPQGFVVDHENGAGQFLPTLMERIFTPTPGIVKGASARNNYGLKGGGFPKE
jgi:hypothetical protein